MVILLNRKNPEAVVSSGVEKMRTRARTVSFSVNLLVFLFISFNHVLWVHTGEPTGEQSKVRGSNTIKLLHAVRLTSDPHPDPSVHGPVEPQLDEFHSNEAVAPRCAEQSDIQLTYVAGR